MNNTGKMIRFILIVSMLVFSGSMSEAAEKGVEETGPLLCAFTKSMVCDSASCDTIEPETVDLPPFFKVDFKNKLITDVEAMGGRQARKKTPIKVMQLLDNNIILQGIELRAWSILISTKTGKMTLTASDDEEAGVFFGSCLAL